MRKFSERLRNLIEEKGITQKFLASELKIPVSTLGGYVQGTSEPDFDTVTMIAEYFEVTVEYLIGKRLRGPGSGVPKEKEMRSLFQRLTEEQKVLFIQLAKSYIKVNRERKK